MFFLWLNIGCGLLILGIFLLIFIFDRKNFYHELHNIRLIVLTGLLIALAVAVNKIAKLVINSPIIEVRLGNFILMLIGFFCGGLLGFLAGIAADFLGILIFNSGTPSLFWTLTSIVWCILPYYLVKLLNKIYHRDWTIYFYLVGTYALTLLLVSGLNPLVLNYMYGDGLWALYFLRLIKYPFDVAVSGLSLLLVYRIFTKSASLNSKICQAQKEKVPDFELQIEQEENTND